MSRWLLCVVMAGLCLLHLYWGFGGLWWRDKASPTLDGRPVLRIGARECFAAAFIFFLLAAVPVVSMKPALRTWLLAGEILVFGGRAVGDFKYLGFFKRVKGTAFAYWDTRVYSPLNVLIAVLAGLSIRGVGK